METDLEQFDSEECRAAALALVVAADRLHRAIAAASPEQGRVTLTAFMLAGMEPAVTIIRRDAEFSVVAGLIDRDGGKHISTYQRSFVFNNEALRDATMRMLRGA